MLFISSSSIDCNGHVNTAAAVVLYKCDHTPKCSRANIAVASPLLVIVNSLNAAVQQGSGFGQSESLLT